jgi:acyl-coenzyme A synthetase/AMP-(fatty) acid ligase
MVLELPIAMLACARIGAIHSIVFGGFSSEAIRDRVQDSDCCLLITSNVSLRGGKKIPLKEISDAAVENAQQSRTSCLSNATTTHAHSPKAATIGITTLWRTLPRIARPRR